MSAIEVKPTFRECAICKVETGKTCLGCGKPFCDKHLFAPANTLVRDLWNCEPCARKANEIQFVEAMQKGLAILFSTGIRGVTIHSPNGVTIKYDAPDLARGLTDTSQITEAFGEGVAAVTKLDDGNVFLEGIFTKENFVAIADDLGWFKQ